MNIDRKHGDLLKRKGNDTHNIEGHNFIHGLRTGCFVFKYAKAVYMFPSKVHTNTNTEITQRSKL